MKGFTGKKSVILMLLVMLMFSFTFTACSLPNKLEDKNEASDKKDKKDDVDEEDDDENEDEDEYDDYSDDEDYNDSLIAVYTGFIPFEYEDSYSDGQDVTVELYDDGSARYTLYTAYGQTSSYTSEYIGYYEWDEVGNICIDTEVSGDEMTAVFGLDGGEIVSYESYYGGRGESAAVIAGEYTCSDPVYGKLMLNIDADGTAYLTIHGDVLSGTVCNYEGQWDVMVNNEDYSECYDWIVEFSGKKFKYITYASYANAEYAGVYALDGDFGAFDVIVDESGEATCSVKIDKELVDFRGTISAYDSDVYGFYLNNEDLGYSLDLNVEYVGNDQGYNGDWNYSGSFVITKTLGAG